MDQRLLRTVEIVSQDPKVLGPLSPAGNALKGIEIWTSRSKIVSEHIDSLGSTLSLVGVVNPLYTPIWGIVDKPYNVYTTDETTRLVFQTILNHSDTGGGISNNALLTKLSANGDAYILFYTEVQAAPSVKCIILELTVGKLMSLIDSDEDDETDRFIDEQKKEDIMETVFQQRVGAYSNMSSKRQAEATVQQQQIKVKQTRLEFRDIISREIKRVMKGKPKPNQNEVAEVCYKAMSFRFKTLIDITETEREVILKWLGVFLDVLGVAPSK